MKKLLISDTDTVLLAERLWQASGGFGEIGEASTAVLLRVLCDKDTSDKRIVDGCGDPSRKDIVPAPAKCCGSYGSGGLRNGNAGLKVGHAHGSVPSSEGSDKSALRGEIRSGRRLSKRGKDSAK